MKRFVMLFMAVLMFMTFVPGCTTTSGKQMTTTQIGVNTVEAMGVTLAQAPSIVDALYTASKITKEQYNQFADIYNKARTAYVVLADAAVVALRAGQEPTLTNAYKAAYPAAVASIADVQALIAQFKGGK
jgi:hypothetical protein